MSNEKPPRGRIARSLIELQARLKQASIDLPEPLEPFIYDVVIVGSGYGGSVAAHELAGKEVAGKKLQVCVLERGREFLPADFPATFGELPRELRVGRQATGEVTGHEGLFDLRLGDDVNALVANGLGGGSLINAGVMLEPRPDDFKGGKAPAGWLDLLERLLQTGSYSAARRLLGAEVQHQGQWHKNSIARLPTLPLKTKALQDLAKQGGQSMCLPPITVALENTHNSAGTALKACNQCGDCMTGCREGAKDSLDANLLAAAAQAGCEIYTGATVISLSRRDEERPRPDDDELPTAAGGKGAALEPHWRLQVAHTNARLQQRESKAFTVRARRVILAAGALGSPEILLRSRSESLSFSERLGQGFSCNGDNIAAVRGLPGQVHGAADEDQKPGHRCVGPTITGAVRLKGDQRDFLLQEFSVPGPMKRLFDEIVTTASTIRQLAAGDDEDHHPSQPDPLAVDPAVMERTLLVGMIGHDDAAGSLRLAQPVRPRTGVPQMGGLCISWPQARVGRELDRAHEAVRTLVEGKQATPGKPSLVPNPMWRILPAGLEDLVSQPVGPVLTVHPLGGCGMAFGNSAGPRDGVVDECGFVFDAAPDPEPGADRWQGSLQVLDASIIPLSLGVNPALTISALALHALRHGCAPLEQPLPPVQLPLDGDLAPVGPPPCTLQPSPAVRRTEVEVIERLWGRAQLQGYEIGPLKGAIIELTLAYEPQAIQTLIGKDRAVPFKVAAQRSCLRLFDGAEWDAHHLAAAQDTDRAKFVQFEAPVGGSLCFMQREATRPLGRKLRGIAAWAFNRGTRDLYELFVESDQGKLGQFGDFWRIASRAGEVRRFDYALKLGAARIDQRDMAHAIGNWPAIQGSKRLTYACRSNPWVQLTTLQLNTFPCLRKGEEPTLKLDTRFLASEGLPLLRVTHQRNHAEGLAEMLSFGLYMARVTISTHLWTFRKPDAPVDREPVRLPGRIKGLPDPEYTDLVVDHWPSDAPGAGQPLSVRLTRYPNPGAKPLVMIHGYSVSGNTFAHPALKPSAAEYFLRKGRDVWLLDLRTSTGLPSATYPWAMEQAALVDIPAALLHVRNLTGQQVDVLAHCIGCVMLSMALLTDAHSVAKGQIQLGPDTWLSAEQLGTLAAFNGVQPTAGAHPVVDRVVLSQKGPVLRYSDDNILRAFVMQYVRRWLLQGEFQFRPSADPKVAEQLLDRLLASLPYPDADFDVEHPHWPRAKTRWSATRHRMDALYGRDFNAANMSAEVLNAIDDLFGPINLDTVAQTIHFARFDAITNQSGRGEFVTRQRLKERWRGIPTLALHGAENGLVDVHTQLLLTRLLKEAAGVPFEAKTYPGIGHQDLLIGVACEKVFKDIDDFLNTRPTAPPNLNAQWVPAPPWIGPRLSPADSSPGALRVAAISRPDQGEATFWLLPAERLGAGRGARYSLIQSPACPPIEGDRGGSGEWLFAAADLAALGGAATAAAAALTAEDSVGEASCAGYLAVFVYLLDDTTAHWSPFEDGTEPALGSGIGPGIGPGIGLGPGPDPGNFAPPEAVPAGAPLQGSPAPARPTASWPRPGRLGVGIGNTNFSTHPHLRVKLPAGLLAKPTLTPAPDTLHAALMFDAETWLQNSPAEALESCFVRLDDMQAAQQLPASRNAAALNFALASCQYPSGLLDKAVAGDSLARMASQPPGFALLVGDQIYADATAGLVDPTRRDELYDQPHERALRLPAMRALLRRVPTQMLLDDHELSDNWEPLPRRGAAGNRATVGQGRLNTVRRNGLKAFLRYQRMKPVPASANLAEAMRQPAPADQAFTWAGHAFYLLDSRSARQRSQPADESDDWHIIKGEQRSRLEKWLLQHRNEVKFIATPSLLLPRRSETAASLRDAARSDSWDGYPASLSWLLQLICEQKIRHTVFLSGDEHHSMSSEIWLGPEATAAGAGAGAAAPDRVKLVSVHSSALYAPFPFANGRMQDLKADELIPVSAYGVRCEVKTRPAATGDGYACIRREDRAGVPGLNVSFHKAAGGAPDTLHIDLA